MNTFCKLTFVLLMLLSAGQLSAQQVNLDKMNEAKRNETLLRIAKEIVMEYGPDYYREYKQPEISHGYVSMGMKQYFTEDEQKKHRNRSYYTVKYLYDKNEEDFFESYSALVVVWGDTGEVPVIYFGNGFGTSIDPKRTKSATKKWPWKKRSPGAFDPPKPRKSVPHEVRPEDYTPDIPKSWVKKGNGEDVKKQ